eukprot:scaffold1128_cov170-Pinguiococcus_pyrenoidosus.AAC.2
MVVLLHDSTLQARARELSGLVLVHSVPSRAKRIIRRIRQSECYERHRITAIQWNGIRGPHLLLLTHLRPSQPIKAQPSRDVMKSRCCMGKVFPPRQKERGQRYLDVGEGKSFSLLRRRSSFIRREEAVPKHHSSRGIYVKQSALRLWKPTDESLCPPQHCEDEEIAPPRSARERHGSLAPLPRGARGVPVRRGVFRILAAVPHARHPDLSLGLALCSRCSRCRHPPLSQELRHLRATGLFGTAKGRPSMVVLDVLDVSIRPAPKQGPEHGKATIQSSRVERRLSILVRGFHARPLFEQHLDRPCVSIPGRDVERRVAVLVSRFLVRSMACQDMDDCNVALLSSCVKRRPAMLQPTAACLPHCSRPPCRPHGLARLAPLPGGHSKLPSGVTSFHCCPPPPYWPHGLARLAPPPGGHTQLQC